MSSQVYLYLYLKEKVMLEQFVDIQVCTIINMFSAKILKSHVKAV